MLKKRLSQLLTEQIEQQQNNDHIKMELYPEEKNYIEIHQLIPDELKEKIMLIEKSNDLRFANAHIERCEKETEQLISEENFDFLKQPIKYLWKHKNEFIYIESQWFEMIGVDALSLEVDDVFGTYNVMMGLKLQKKYESSLKEQLDIQLSGEKPKFALIFNHEDGLWDFNFTLNYVDGFTEEKSIGEATLLIYRFLFSIVDHVTKRL